MTQTDINKLATEMVGDGKSPNKYFVSIAYGWYMPKEEDAEMKQAKDSLEPVSDINYCTDSAVEYFIGYNGDKALVVAKIHDEDIYMINKDELREMSLTARVAGIKSVTLVTNYGLELHSRLENAKTVGFDKIIKISSI